MRVMRSVIVGFAAIFLAACTSVCLTRGHGISEKFHQSYQISAGGSVSLRNINGDVQIKVWDKNEVLVDAVKYAESKDRMDQLKIIVDVSSDRVDIDTKYPKDDDTHGGGGISVEYVVTVPKTANIGNITTVNGDVNVSGAGGDVIASTVNGNIDVSGLGKDCDLKTVNGKIHADFASLSSDADVKLNSVNGSLVLGLPAGANASVKADALVGHISNEFGLTSSDEHGEHPFVKVGDSLRGKIGNGGADIRLHTVNGSIEILKLASR